MHTFKDFLLLLAHPVVHERRQYFGETGIKYMAVLYFLEKIEKIILAPLRKTLCLLLIPNELQYRPIYCLVDLFIHSTITVLTIWRLSFHIGWYENIVYYRVLKNCAYKKLSSWIFYCQNVDDDGKVWHKIYNVLFPTFFEL